MASTISAIVKALRALVTLAVLALAGAGSWIAYSEYNHRSRLEHDLQARTVELAETRAQVERLTQENERLNLALRLLKIDHRLAEIKVLEQHDDADRLKTKFQFVELNKDGDPIGPPRVFTIDGDIAYVDAWVIKYSDELIEQGDPLRSTSVCLFRRIFGEHQEPRTGFAIDPAGSRPAVYSQGDEMSPAERDIWTNFWEYANNPAKARNAGLRAAHGEAPYIRLEKGKLYKVELRASGGLSITSEDLPLGDAS